MTAHPDGVRQRQTISYRTLVKTTLVQALREVFTSSYYDEAFRNLNVYTSFPLDKAKWPLILVDYHGRAVRAAGVGHVEMFKDNFGQFREWEHRRFQGTVEFTIITLSPLDRDILADSLIEILTMGRLDELLTRFFWTVYGEPSDQKQSFLNQLALNTDEIHEGGDSEGPAPWQPEDVIVYQTSIMLDVFGGFYNLITTDALEFVWKVNMEPYPQGEIPVSITYRPDVAWTPPFEYADTDGYATGQAEISAEED